MKPERWQQVREVLHDAMQMDEAARSAFLDSQCATDPSLRAELNELLAVEGEIGPSFLESPALAHAPVHTDNSATGTVLAAGTKLGPYVVQVLIGAGGMGEVYRARDASLKRDVAIKVLPASFSRDPDRLRRFQLEAEAAAALNHANILSIFAVGQQDGSPYIVTELLEGETLRERLRHGALKLRDATDIAIQIAKGLAAAHEKGIAHRDLKPENLFIAKDGRIKILDFGLAKLMQSPSGSDAATVSLRDQTDAGRVLGTVGYMSPEQVRGEPADARSDIFSLGCVLYEMLTGKRAFRKPTSTETTTAILNEDPPAISQIAPGTPPALLRIVHRCLEKNPEQRSHSASDLAFALEAVPDTRVPSSGIEATQSRTNSRWSVAVATVAAVVLLGAGAVYYRLRTPIGSSQQWVQLTSFVDSATSPALSPDGRMMAFIRGPETFVTPGQIYVKMLPDGQPVQLTHDDSPKMAPAFSPDGSRIAYTTTDSSAGWNTWVVPVLGGEPEELLPNAAALTWADGEHVVFSEIKTGGRMGFMGIATATESRAGEREIYLPADTGGMAHRSWLSPDGKWILVSEMDRVGWRPCRVLPFDGSSSGETAGPKTARCTYAGWSPDGKTMYFSADAGNGFHIWRQHFPGGVPEQLTFGPTEEEGVAVSPDGHSLVTSAGIKENSVWVHDARGDRQISGEGFASLPGLGFAGGGARSVFSPDGKRLYYLVRKQSSRAFKSGQLWMTDLDSGRSEVVLPGVSMTEFDIAPDGEHVAFTTVDAEETPHVWIAPLDRHTPPKQLTSTVAHMPCFGPGGDVYFVAREGDLEAVYSVGRDETVPRKMNLGPGADPKTISPHGDWWLFGFAPVVAFPTQGGPPIRICKFCSVAWGPDDKFLYLRFRDIGEMGGGRTIAIALPPGKDLPNLPADGLTSAKDVKGLNVVADIDMKGMVIFAPGPSPSIYAYDRRTVQRNLFRIPLK